MKIEINLRDTGFCNECPLCQEGKGIVYYCLKYPDTIIETNRNMRSDYYMSPVRPAICVTENGE